MAIRHRERPSAWLDLLLAGAALAMVLFGGLFAARHDWVAGVFALAATLGAARLGQIKLQFIRARRAEAGARGWATHGDGSSSLPAEKPSGQAFVCRATHQVRARSRQGFVVVGRDVAAFLPTTEWRHLAVQIAVGLVATRVNLSEIEMDATDSPDLAQELADLVRVRGGLLLDESWAWVRPGVAMARAQSEDFLSLHDSLPADCVARWPLAPAAPASARRRLRLWFIGTPCAVAVCFAVFGIVSWRITDNSDLLAAGLSFSGLLALSVVAALVLVRRSTRQRPR